MPGSLYLGCGNAADEEPLWRSMLHRAHTKIVYWPFALPPELSARADNWLRRSLDQLDVGYQLDTWQDLANHDTAELDPDPVDLLFVGGGNTFQLLEHARQLAADLVRAAELLGRLSRHQSVSGGLGSSGRAWDTKDRSATRQPATDDGWRALEPSAGRKSRMSRAGSVRGSLFLVWGIGNDAASSREGLDHGGIDHTVSAVRVSGAATDRLFGTVAEW